MVLMLHNRYRTPGGEERAVGDLAWLVREHLGEPCEILERDSSGLGRTAATRALLRGGVEEDAVGDAVRRTGARIVHAHNLTPLLGWRALAAARAAGAKVVLHLHNYRLVCAQGTCFAGDGRDCARCQGRDTLPGVRLDCRRAGRAEAATYAAGIAAWQRRLVAEADAIVVPSQAALARLRELRAPIEDRPVHVVGHVLRAFADAPGPLDGGYALVASRLAVEKGVGDAVLACRAAGLPLVVCGDGPLADRLRRAAPEVDFRGRVDEAGLAALRVRAAVALAPTRAQETFGLAALEAMAAGVPTVAVGMGAQAELPETVPPGDVDALGAAAARLAGDRAAGVRAIAAARERCAPEAVAARLAAVHASL